MGLEHIDRAIYTAGKSTNFDTRMRRIVLGKLGIPKQKAITEYRGELLTSARQTAEVLSGRLDEAPDALDLVVFSGRVNDGWHELVARAYEAIGRKIGYGNIEVHLAALDEIFKRIGAVRAAFSMGRKFDPAKAVVQIGDAVPKLPAMLVQAVQRRVILVMLSDGEDFVREGQLAAQLGMIDGAFDTLETTQNPVQAIRHLKECLRSRGI